MTVCLRVDSLPSKPTGLGPKRPTAWRIGGHLLAALIAFGSSPALGQRSASTLGHAVVSGTVTDEAKSPLPGVTVMAVRGDDTDGPVVVTTATGAFRIENLPPGSWEIRAVLDGFQSVSRQVKIVSDQALQLALTMIPAITETVAVTGAAFPTGEVAILESRRLSAVVSDSISAEEIQKSPDSDAGAVVERLTGVSLVGDKYVFIRGLGERYSGATINGATLPTTETERRVVPLDLFPAKLLETVEVAKTYTPEKPGDFGSGVVEMTTTSFPSAPTFKASVGVGVQSAATGEPFRRYAGGLNRLGNGGQPIPGAIPPDFLTRQDPLNPSGFTPADLEVFGESLVGDWVGDQDGSAPPLTNLSLSYGNTFGALGVVLSAVSNHSFDKIVEEQRFFGLDEDDLVPRNDYDLTTDREHTSAGFVGNFSLRLNEKNRVYISSVFTRDATAEDRLQEGLNTNSGGFVRDFRTRYQDEEIFSNRLRGEHNLAGPGLGSLVDWSLAYSEASNASDLRENLYRESEPGVFALQVGDPESGKIQFFDLEEQITQGGLAYSIFQASAEGTWSGSVKAGVDYLERVRDFNARRLRFTTSNQLQFDLTQAPEDIFTPENIRPNGFEIREVTGVNDAYDAEHTVGAAFLMADAALGQWRFIGGARYEDSDQRVFTFNPFDIESAVEAVDENRNLLPSLNAVYQYGARTNLRFAYGRSVNRPEFRELSPFTFVEVTGGRSIAGNPDLTQATLDNVDIRWETFPSPGEVIAASVFYKSLHDPIERIVQPTTELRTSFINAESAELWGIELEFRRSLETVARSLRFWSVNANYAYIQSDVTVGEQQLSVVTNTERPLQGQSDQVWNFALQFLRPEWGTMARLLAAYTGERLSDVGAFGLPDIYEDAFLSVDLVVSQEVRFLPGLEVKLAATNLLDEDHTFTQGSEIQRRFEPGRVIGLSLSYATR